MAYLGNSKRRKRRQRRQGYTPSANGKPQQLVSGGSR